MPAADAVTLHDRVLGSEGGSSVTASPDGDAVIVKDTPERIARLRLLLGWLDLPGTAARRLYVRPTKHRSPSELTAVTRRVLGDAMGKDLGLAPDDRSGLLVVRATPPTYRTIDRLLRRLDIPPRDERRIFVLPGRTAIPLPGN